jgi:ATP-binding cassette, subfamily C, bacterial CydD
VSAVSQFRLDHTRFEQIIKPIDSRLLREVGATRWFIAGVVVLAMLGSAATITISWSASLFISQVFIQHASMQSVSFCLGWLLLGGTLKALTIWLQELAAVKATAAVKLELRKKFFEALNALGPGWVAKRSAAEVNLLATTGLDSLDPYFAKYLPQVVYTALITPAFVVIIWLSDFSSGLVLLLTIPLVPIFMILIGWATRSVQQKQLEALNALSRHFLEVLRGLTTLKIFGRAKSQVEILTRVSEEHRLRTMKVLRVTFLSGFALELISSLAVALIAVSIGLRLLSGDISLVVGLFVLLLAPEAFLPLRQVGAKFHASSEGVTASTAILDVIDSARAVPQKIASSNLPNFELGSFYAITGPSGAGKSSIFTELLGLGASTQTLSFAECAWMPQQNKLFAGTVTENIVGVDVTPDIAVLKESMRRAALDDLDGSVQVGENGSAVSGGQAQRICAARTFYRALNCEVQLLLLDEPISALDPERASVIVESLKLFAKEGNAVVAISHQTGVIEAADAVIEVGLV